MTTKTRDWKERLDSRVTVCTGCDEWRWDGTCKRCDHDDERTNEG